MDLRGAPQACHRWRVFDDVSFEGSNVDHAVIGSLGVAAVETKFRGLALYDGARLPSEEELDQARRAARKLRLLLREAHRWTEPVPVLVRWGPGVQPAEPVIRDGVLVLDADWAGRCRGAASAHAT